MSAALLAAALLSAVLLVAVLLVAELSLSFSVELLQPASAETNIQRVSKMDKNFVELFFFHDSLHIL